MLSSFIDMIKDLFGFLKLPLMALAFISVVFCVYIFLYVLYFILIKKERLKKRTVPSKLKRPSALYRLLVMFPKQYALDLIRLDPDAFPYKGLVIFTGKQGKGKSVAMTSYAREMQLEYPLVKIIDNYGYKESNKELSHWSDLINYNNGIYGVIAIIDETQNWFSCKQSKDFPPEMLQVITQNRKNRRIILGTAQNFSNLAKDIRRQCTEVRECRTFFNCITVVRRKEPIMDDEGNVKEYIAKGMYFFVHTDELRGLYDTWKTIEALGKSGFYPRNKVEVELKN